MSEGPRKKGMYGDPTAKSIPDDRRSAPPPLETATNSLSLNPSSPPRKQAVIKNTDMKEDMQKDAVDIAISAFEKTSVEKDIAEHIKKEFDKKHGATWHCIVGRNFGSYVTHETNHFVYFYLDQKAVLLFKSG